MFTPAQRKMIVALSATDAGVLANMLAAAGLEAPAGLPHAGYLGRVLDNLNRQELWAVLVESGFATPEAFATTAPFPTLNPNEYTVAIKRPDHPWEFMGVYEQQKFAAACGQNSQWANNAKYLVVRADLIGSIYEATRPSGQSA